MTIEEAVAQMAVSMAGMADAVTSLVTLMDDLLTFRGFTGNLSGNHQRFVIGQDLIAKGYTEQEATAQITEWLKDPTKEEVLIIVPASKGG